MTLGSMGNLVTGQHWPHTVPATIDPLTWSIFSCEVPAAFLEQQVIILLPISEMFL